MCDTYDTLLKKKYIQRLMQECRKWYLRPSQDQMLSTPDTF